MTELVQSFTDQFQRSVRWNNRHEKGIAHLATSLASGLNEAMDGTLAFNVNPAYFQDNTFQIDCRKADTSSCASVRGQLNDYNFVMILDCNGSWQGMAKQNETDYLQSIIVGFFAREFGAQEKDMHRGVVYREELDL